MQVPGEKNLSSALNIRKNMVRAPDLVATQVVNGNTVIGMENAAHKVEPIKYVTPILRINFNVGNTVFQFRDSATGEIKREYPSSHIIEKYEKLREMPELKPVIQQDKLLVAEKRDADISPNGQGSELLEDQTITHPFSAMGEGAVESALKNNDAHNAEERKPFFDVSL